MACSKYGIKILNIEAKSLYECNLGIRFHYDFSKAMFANSLLLNYLKENGLKIEKNGWTKDIICLKFNQDSRSYESEKEHWEYLIKNKHSKKNVNKIYNDKTIEFFKQMLQNTEDKKDLFCERTKEEIRELFYENGVEVLHMTQKKDGTIKTTKTVHYKMLYRSTGKAKSGECMFICDRLYDKAIKFIRMGLKMPKENAPIVEMSAYSSLVASTIVDTLSINPKNILILNDVDSFFKTNIISVETNKNKECVAIEKENYNLKNTIFDGQGLIDESIFPKWGEGYVLLRHHMCKMACFKSKIQKFFKDYYGDDYENAKVKDMFGNEHYVKDVRLITTDNAMKWLKFNVSYEDWCNKVFENGCNFGIVKTAHKSKLGEVQKMSYQMVNSLDMDIMPNVVEESVKFINLLKTNTDVFIQYLKDNQNFSNDYEVLVALYEQNNDFERSEYFRNRRYEIIKSYVSNFKMGKVIQEADNLVIVGSPYAMLLHSVGEDVENDPTFSVEEDSIQCFTTRFDDGEYLAEFRNPFNSKNNMGYLHNVYNDLLFKYFDFGNQIIAVNMIHTCFQDRNNGSDQDSDSIYCTNQKDIVSWAKHCQKNYPTIVNNIPKDQNKYNNTLRVFAQIDNRLAKAQESIGISSNVAQLAQTYSYNFEDQKYKDYVCILSVIAQIAIDSAKRSFDIDIEKEIKRISKDMGVSENKYPQFWKMIQDKKRNKQGRSSFPQSNINTDLICPMNYLCNIEIKRTRDKKSTLPMNYFFNKYELENDRRKSKKVEELIEKYSIDLFEYYQKGISKQEDVDKEYLILIEQFDELLEEIKRTYISKTYIGLMSWLIDRAFCITNQVKSNEKNIQRLTNKNKVILLKVLYDINPSNLLKIFSKNA